jgi:hypothetical protein
MSPETTPPNVDLEIGEKLFESAINVLQATVALQEVFKNLPKNKYMKPVEFDQGGWTYKVSVSEIDGKFNKERIIHVRRQQDGKVEQINIKKNYIELSDAKPFQINCRYEFYSFYEPVNRIDVQGEISADFILDFIQDINV